MQGQFNRKPSCKLRIILLEHAQFSFAFVAHFREVLLGMYVTNQLCFQQPISMCPCERKADPVTDHTIVL